MDYKKLLLTQKEQQAVLPAFDEHLLFALERRYLDMLDMERLELAMNPAEGEFNFKSDLRLIRIDEVSHEGSADSGLHLLNMQNVLSALKDDGHAVVNLVMGDGHSTSVYYGLSRRIGHPSHTSTHEYARILSQTMHGNFLGAKFSPLSAEETFHQVMRPIYERREVLAVPGIPSLRLKDPKGPFAQGIDRFVEGMRGEKYALVIIAEPVSLTDLDGMIGNLWDLGTSIHSSVRATIQKTKGSSDTFNIGMFGMKGTTEGLTEGEALTDTDSEATTKTLGISGGASAGVPGFGAFMASFASISKTVGFAHSVTRNISKMTGGMFGGGGYGGYSRSWNRSMSVSQEVLNKRAEHCEELCNQYIKRLQDGKNLGFWNVGIYLLAENKYTQLRGRGLLRAVLSGDETHWEPIRAFRLNGDALGQYISSFNNPQYNLLLYGQERSDVEEAVGAGARLRRFCEQLGKDVQSFLSSFAKKDIEEQARLLEEIRRCPADFTPEQVLQAWDTVREANLGHPLGPMMGGVSTPLNTEELSIAMNVPRQEIQGITIREAAPFGVNYSVSGDPDKQLTIGHIIHKREVLQDAPFSISRKAMMKHGFICGITGSGKTNTLMHLLREGGVPFMVNEPSKSEYGQLLHILPELRVFSLGNDTVSPFRLNPFEFPQGIELLTHIDYLKAVFNAAFPMYASMPYLLEEAIVEVYLDKGWELATTTNRFFEMNQARDFSDYLPTLEDLFAKIDQVVERKKYAQELSMDLSAALKARLSSLLTGSKGLMLNTKKSTPMEELLNDNVVLELKYIGDDDEKAFVMGLLFSRLYEYREATYDATQELKHITVIEEAHRLLKRVSEVQSMEAGNARGKAVETFTNILSEIRVYGECMLVVDQIPAKLTPDVVKNTGLKIVHRLLAADDRDIVGDTMTLTKEQKREIPLLRVGQVVVHREDLDKPFLIQVPPTKDDFGRLITNDEVIVGMKPYHDAHINIFNRMPGFELHPDIPVAYSKCDFRRFDPAVYGAIIKAAAAFIECPPAVMKASMEAAVRTISERLRPRNTVEHLCYITWYANRLFSNLNMAYPGHFDCVLSAHKKFMDLWA
jgi:DNA helicase HerA-like ATPase